MADIWSRIGNRAITEAEQFCQTYLAVIHGAKAMIRVEYDDELRETDVE